MAQAAKHIVYPDEAAGVPVHHLVVELQKKLGVI